MQILNNKLLQHYFSQHYVQKNYKVADKFKDVLESKLEKLERYFVNDINVRVHCEEQNKVQDKNEAGI